jgi:hypothetical protein
MREVPTDADGTPHAAKLPRSSQMSFLPLVGLRLQSLLGPGEPTLLWNHHTRDAVRHELQRREQFDMCRLSINASVCCEQGCSD